MKRMAIVRNGVVVNIAVWDGESAWNPDHDTMIDVTDLHVGVGYSYDGDTFYAPPEPEPEIEEIEE